MQLWELVDLKVTFPTAPHERNCPKDEAVAEKSSILEVLRRWWERDRDECCKAAGILDKESDQEELRDTPRPYQDKSPDPAYVKN